MPNTWYIDSGSGTDTGQPADGNTWETALKTIKYAVNTVGTSSANNAAIFIVSASAPYHTSEINPKADNIVVKSKAGERASLDGGLYDASGYESDECIDLGGNSYSGSYWENLDFVNWKHTDGGYVISAGGTTQRGAMFSLSGCNIFNNVKEAIKTISGGVGHVVGSYEDADSTALSGYAVIKDCRIFNNALHGAGDSRPLTINGAYVQLINTVIAAGEIAQGELVANGHFHTWTTASFCTFVSTGSEIGGSGDDFIQIG